MIKKLFRRSLQTAALTALFVCAGAFTSFASPASLKNGNVDGMEGNTLYGWAWDTTKPSEGLTLHVVITEATDSDAETASEADQETAEGESVVWYDEVVADNYRADLEAGRIGDGTHAWTAEVPEGTLKADTSYCISMYADEMQIGTSALYENGTITQIETQSEAETLAASGTPVSLGRFKTTAYCPCYKCSEGWGHSTSTGAVASEHHTIAVDPKVIPYGSKLLINGVVYTAEDEGGGVKGNHIDIFYESHSECLQYGVQYAEVYLLS